MARRQQRRSRSARWRAWAVASSIVIVVAIGFSARLFVWPATAADPSPADAIVVFAGGGDRAGKGIELAESGLADTVVFASAYVDPPGVWAVRYCNRSSRPDPPLEVECVEPEPGTTRGEARFTAELARERGWDDIILVVSTDQVTRARMLLGRCWDGHVQVVDVAHHQPLPWRVLYEWGAMAKAMTVARGC